MLFSKLPRFPESAQWPLSLNLHWKSSGITVLMTFGLGIPETTPLAASNYYKSVLLTLPAVVLDVGVLFVASVMTLMTVLHCYSFRVQSSFSTPLWEQCYAVKWKRWFVIKKTFIVLYSQVKCFNVRWPYKVFMFCNLHTFSKMIYVFENVQFCFP